MRSKSGTASATLDPVGLRFWIGAQPATSSAGKNVGTTALNKGWTQICRNRGSTSATANGGEDWS